MAASMASLALFFLCISFVSAIGFASSSTAPLCPSQSRLFINSLQSQCPGSTFPSSAIEVDGESLDNILSSSPRNSYTAVLFYASWCPFSRDARSAFGTLSSMFPQIRHLAIEQSSAMPSVFSRYGIRSMPSILMVNQTGKMRHYGPKVVNSLAYFYERTTGLEQVDYLTHNQQCGLGAVENMQSLNSHSLKERFRTDSYLVYSILFLFLRTMFCLYPRILAHLRAFWISYGPHLNLGIFGGTGQLLERVFHVIDVRRVWSKMRLCKTKNLRKGAKSARVWASSLASVSLGESSSA